MDINTIRQAEERISCRIKSEYKDPEDKSKPIIDGIVNPEVYAAAQNSPRILWVLKEPYCDGKERKGGGWSMRKLLNTETDRMSRQPTFRPICYVGYGIWNKVLKSDDILGLRNNDDVRSCLRRIAFININKLPGLTSTRSTAIKAAYRSHRDLILDQIKTYDPNIIFACIPHVHLLRAEFQRSGDGLPLPDWKWFSAEASRNGTAAAIQISPQQRLVWVDHPAARKNKRCYVEDAIKAATAVIDS